MGKARNIAMLSVDTAGAIATTNLTNAPNPISAGSIQSWPSNTIPTGWLKCNGAAVSRTLYSSLFSAIGTTYGTGDGSTTFNLPDMRGEFLRGLDDGRGVDSGRSIGTGQAFATQEQTGQVTGGFNTDHGFIGATGSSVSGVFSLTNYRANRPQGTAGSGSYSTLNIAVGTSGATETRPRNRAMHYIIKF